MLGTFNQGGVPTHLFPLGQRRQVPGRLVQAPEHQHVAVEVHSGEPVEGEVWPWAPHQPVENNNNAAKASKPIAQGGVGYCAFFLVLLS